ncbi:Hypothetical predicted protein [Mytilus galloprovincialis]|uniref:Reverse transcriptase domain-containing protein n=1 Tax=Mytilus galloprovincialis TaxID=29158 RepID=A0A8B6FYS9_MYTGA|nr:Hypothetical predicted protein [Mytilus galloprovincialis]
MDSDTPHEEISLRTVLDAVNRQKQDIEVLVDTKISEKINSLRDEIHGTNQSMKSQVKKLKSDSQYKWRSEGNKIQFNYNTENLEDLTQAIWAIDNGKVDYARDIVASCTDRLKHRNKLIKIADTSDGGWDTARQYEANPIASDSEDESKIIRAENRAIRKKKTLSRGPAVLVWRFPVCPGPVRWENLNGDHASTVGRTNTGELTALSKTTRQQHQTKETSFVKDEYNFDISSLDNESAQNFTHDYYEYEQDGTDIIVKGRLKENIQFWIDIGAYDYIIDTIRDGYKIPFYSIPPSTYLFNNLSALKNSDFVHTAIQDLLHRGLIVQCDQRPFVVNPLTVSVQSNLKKRLILDLRAVNKHLWKQSVKFEDMRTAQQHIKLNYSMFKYDVHSAYHHIDIFEPHTEYLGFSWIINGCPTFFKFLVLPFG